MPRLELENNEEALYREYEMASEKSRKFSAGFLFVIAFMTIAQFGIIYSFFWERMMMDGIQKVTFFFLAVVSSSIFFGLSYWAKSAPLIPTVIGFVLYAGSTIFQFIVDPVEVGPILLFRLLIMFGFVHLIKLARRTNALAAKLLRPASEYATQKPHPQA